MNLKSIYTLSAKPSTDFWKKIRLTDSYLWSNLKYRLAELPARVDLRDTGFVGPVKDQGTFEVSIGIALVNGCLEFSAKKSYDMNHELSCLYPYKKDRSSLFPDKTNTMTCFLDAIQVLREDGCPPGRLDSHINYINYGSFDWTIVSTAMVVKKCYRLSSIWDIKHCLSSGYPVACLLRVYPSLFDVEVYRSGHIEVPESSESPIGFHGLSIVGFDDSIQSFIVKNSWSKSWGDYGFGYLPYHALPSMLAEAYSLRL